MGCMNDIKTEFLLNEEDISFIPFEDILAVLPNPTKRFAGIRGYTPLHVAAMFGREEIMEVLINTY
ncbi:hypothetical protein AVEN_264427-1, partial [Araneus ventricosus]